MPKPYLELFGFRDNPEIQRRVRVATELKAADILLDSGANADAKTRARAVLRNEGSDLQYKMAVLRCMVDQSIREVGIDCTDAQIQTVIDASFLQVF